MTGVIMFLVGLFVGCSCGVLLLAMLIASRDDDEGTR